VISGEDLDSLIKIGKIERKQPVKQIVHRPLPASQPKLPNGHIEITPDGIRPLPA
jgi:hypothetical protein